MTSDAKTKKNILKDIIRDLHAGGNVEALQARFAALVKDVSGAEIGAMEQELIDEGLPETEVRRLCDLHVKVFESPSTPGRRRGRSPDIPCTRWPRRTGPSRHSWPRPGGFWTGSRPAPSTRRRAGPGWPGSSKT